MKAILYDNELIEVPEILNCGDTIIYNDKIYQISSKTWDHDNNEFYCKVVVYQESITNAIDILSKIYDSDYFETSGFNTNNVNDNPRLFILLTILTVILGNDYMAINGLSYKQNIISAWNRKKISFEEIVNDYPKVVCSDIKKICKSATVLLEMNKISKNLWPNFIIQTVFQSNN